MTTKTDRPSLSLTLTFDEVLALDDILSYFADNPLPDGMHPDLLLDTEILRDRLSQHIDQTWDDEDDKGIANPVEDIGFSKIMDKDEPV